MATTETQLDVRLRTRTGTTAAQALRAVGRIPANLFGHGVEATALDIDAKSFDAMLHGAGPNALLTIAIAGGDRDTVLVREVQRDPITRRVLHADLQRVRASEEIEAALAVVAIGVAAGVKNDGGVLDVVLHTIDVRGPANALPEQLEVPVEKLAVHDKILASELALPKNFTLVTAGELVVMTVEPSKVAQQAAEDEIVVAEQTAEAAAEAAEPDPIRVEPGESAEGDTGAHGTTGTTEAPAERE